MSNTEINCACRHGCDHPQGVMTKRGFLVCMDCWVHRKIISILRPWDECYIPWVMKNDSGK